MSLRRSLVLIVVGAALAAGSTSGAAAGISETGTLSVFKVASSAS